MLTITLLKFNPLLEAYIIESKRSFPLIHFERNMIFFSVNEI